MSEGRANVHPVQSDGPDREWEILCSRLEEIRAFEEQESCADELCVERLRRAVRSRVEQEEAPVRRRVLYLCALAAAVLPAALGLGSLFGGISPVAEPPSLVLTARSDGSVLMRYSDGRPIRRVVKSELPSGAKLESVLTPGRTEVVDKNGAPRPGTVVFYRID